MELDWYWVCPHQSLIHIYSYDYVCECVTVSVCAASHIYVDAVFVDLGITPLRPVSQIQPMHVYNMSLLTLIIFFYTAGEFDHYAEMISEGDKITVDSSVPGVTSCGISALLSDRWLLRKWERRGLCHPLDNNICIPVGGIRRTTPSNSQVVTDCTDVVRGMNLMHGMSAQKWASLWYYLILSNHGFCDIILNINFDCELSLVLNTGMSLSDACLIFLVWRVQQWTPFFLLYWIAVIFYYYSGHASEYDHTIRHIACVCWSRMSQVIMSTCTLYDCIYVSSDAVIRSYISVDLRAQQWASHYNYLNGSQNCLLLLLFLQSVCYCLTCYLYYFMYDILYEPWKTTGNQGTEVYFY